jgi:hypothetical protein
MSTDQSQQNNFKAEILDTMGEIEFSNTQKIRVLLIRDPEQGVCISCQKWWRPNTSSDWIAGKGFTLDGRESLQLSDYLGKAGKRIIHLKN